MTTRLELAGLPAIPETALADALLAGLPANRAAAPWECRCTGLIWLGAGGRPANAALPPALRGNRALATLGGFLRYDDTPVGAYDEVFGVVASHTGASPWGTVALMAVDSPASLVGGRTNWAMPKTLAHFSGGPARGMAARSADGDVAWSLSATPRPVGPALPWRGRAIARQEFPGGRVGASRLVLRARLRPALVSIEVSSAGTLAGWLRPGRHLGAVVESATFTLDAPVFERAAEH
jgi:hypothetical protein